MRLKKLLTVAIVAMVTSASVYFSVGSTLAAKKPVTIKAKTRIERSKQAGQKVQVAKKQNANQALYVGCNGFF